MSRPARLIQGVYPRPPRTTTDTGKNNQRSAPHVFPPPRRPLRHLHFSGCTLSQTLATDRTKSTPLPLSASPPLSDTTTPAPARSDTQRRLLRPSPSRRARARTLPFRRAEGGSSLTRRDSRCLVLAPSVGRGMRFARSVAPRICALPERAARSSGPLSLSASPRVSARRTTSHSRRRSQRSGVAPRSACAARRPCHRAR